MLGLLCMHGFSRGHTRFVKWVHTPIDERRHHPGVEQIVACCNPHLVHLDSTEVILGLLPTAVKDFVQKLIHIYDFINFQIYIYQCISLSFSIICGYVV